MSNRLVLLIVALWTVHCDGAGVTSSMESPPLGSRPLAVIEEPTVPVIPVVVGSINPPIATPITNTNPNPVNPTTNPNTNTNPNTTTNPVNPNTNAPATRSNTNDSGNQDISLRSSSTTNIGVATNQAKDKKPTEKPAITSVKAVTNSQHNQDIKKSNNDNNDNNGDNGDNESSTSSEDISTKKNDSSSSPGTISVIVIVGIGLLGTAVFVVRRRLREDQDDDAEEDFKGLEEGNFIGGNYNNNQSSGLSKTNVLDAHQTSEAMGSEVHRDVPSCDLTFSSSEFFANDFALLESDPRPNSAVYVAHANTSSSEVHEVML